MEETRERMDSGCKSQQRKALEMMDVLCETGVALEATSRLCTVLRMGFESPDFCDGRDAAACVWVIGQLLDWLCTDKISPEIMEK